MTVACLLCASNETVDLPVAPSTTSYLWCRSCDLRFMNPDCRLNQVEEKARYLKHTCGVEDAGYRKFVQPLVDEISKRASIGARGLDYGAGNGAVLAETLRGNGYDISLFDPFFWPDASVLERKYHFIVACEVAEHFFNPAAEFVRLRSLLEPGGFLAMKTTLYDPSIDFENWHYRRDPTHVVFYSANSIRWIARECGFSSEVTADESVVILKKCFD